MRRWRERARRRSGATSGRSTWRRKSSHPGSRPNREVAALAARPRTEPRPGPGPAVIATADLKIRASALRQAAAMPEAELRSLLDAALAELDAAVTSLAGYRAAPDGDGP